MVVINCPSSRWFRNPTDSADAALCCQHLISLGRSDAIALDHGIFATVFKMIGAPLALHFIAPLSIRFAPNFLGFSALWSALLFATILAAAMALIWPVPMTMELT